MLLQPKTFLTFHRRDIFQNADLSLCLWKKKENVVEIQYIIKILNVQVNYFIDQ